MQGLIKALIMGGAVAISEMPFSDMDRMIAFILERFGNRNFFTRQALPVEIRHIAFGFGVDVTRQGAIVFGFQVIGNHRHHTAHARRSRRIFIACARGITSGHQHSAGRRTGRIARIGLCEDGAPRSEAINIGCGHSPAR